MSRTEEVIETVKFMNELVNSKKNVTSDEARNLELVLMVTSLNEISVTLAMIYDLMNKEKKE